MEQKLHKWLAQKADRFTPNEQRLVEHLVKHLELWAFESAGKIAEITRVHRSTIVRFAKNLGFSGYPDFQVRVRSDFLKTVHKQNHLVLNRTISPDNDAVQDVFDREIRNLQLTYENLDRDVLEKTARDIAAARNVLIFGRRFSHPIALHLYYTLRLFREGVQLAPEAGGITADSLFDLDGRDYALMVTLHRYSPYVQKTIRFLEKRGVPQTLLTDINPTPAIDGKHIRMLRAHIGSTTVLDSYTALNSICHTLLILVRQCLPQADERMQTVESAVAEFFKL